jgi:flagellar motility protein MotE (MotC chaperone)
MDTPSPRKEPPVRASRAPRLVVGSLLFLALVGASADAQVGENPETPAATDVKVPVVGTDEASAATGSPVEGVPTPSPQATPMEPTKGAASEAPSGAPTDANGSRARSLDGNAGSYLCRPATLSAEALLREIDKRHAAIEQERAALDEKRRSVDAVVAALREETLRLETRLAEEAKRKEQETAAERGREDKARIVARQESEARLAKGVAKMDGKSAAAVLISLEKDLAATVLKKLPPAQAGAALAAMDPNVAAALIEHAALRRPATATTPGASPSASPEGT